ncbi:hypothetical protein ACFQMA_16625 [Halosimplex aquaticum]|uniref:DUF7344 domain-containing protein n=1 Tax=Halosimplex aquaticum TaxID=3026162 RepID=A0ABD5Y258_9EURY|nr:hypothetical protein [Halosimplex aquaticum]
MSRITCETDDGNGDRELTDDECYDLLADERRRLALAELAERSAPIALDDLAAAVAAREVDGATPSATDTQRAAVSLHHAHLPRMADLGVIDYDAQTNRIERVGDVPTSLPA